MSNDITDAEFPGPAPYAIPLLARVESLDSPGHPEFALLRCAFEDGALVFVPIANQAVETLIQFLKVHRLKLAQAEADDETKH